MADNCFSKDYRLLSARDFSYLRRGSSQVKNKWLMAYFKPTQSTKESPRSHSRLGLSVSKKVGKANIRNLCKRHVKDFFRQSSFKYEGYDVLVLVSPMLFKRNETKEQANDALKSAIPHLFKLIEKNIQSR
ncbi:ribonuclease P protein component [Halobacteriovorax sp. GB3]|uniref:ribonuclease P protein component n=1 Tax=Halobacteriovorax sp. GB3 TaxID=2719615 RepID=UPI002362616B|nr:ribonuclease P protein component [Halobacteriovorax sp. GB3]MDD0854731.1 ribonuclease P protein component [Halobacteriovorax sp. GB3]